MARTAPFKLSRQADRRALADLIQAELATVPGVVIERTNEKRGHPYDSRRVHLRATVGDLSFTTSMDGDSTWGVIAHWNVGLGSGARLCMSFGSTINGTVNPHHFGKATGPFTHGDREVSAEVAEFFAGKVRLGLEEATNGSAFQELREAA